MTTILVTGATGTVGSRVLAHLCRAGHDVRAFVRDRNRAPSVPLSDMEVVVGDLGDPESIRVAVKGVDAVFLACGNGPRQVDDEINVIDAAAGSGARRIVKLSNLGAEAGSPIAFWDSNGRIEHHLRRAAIPSVVLRPAFYMSNLFASSDTIRHAGQFFLPAGRAEVAMVDPDDVAAVAAVALTAAGHDGETYRLTGPEALTFDAVADRLSAALGRTVTFVDVPDDAAREALVGAGLPDWFAGNLVKVFGALRAGAADTVTDDVRKVTGAEPRTFAAFVRPHAQIFGL